MKLQKFIKNKKQKRIVIGSIVGILVLIGGISLYRTFAMYKIERSFDVLQGTVPDFNTSDIKLAITLDEEEVEDIPAKEIDKNYKVEVECDKGANGSWNYNKWQVEVKEFKKGTKCNVSFKTIEEKIPTIPSNVTLLDTIDTRYGIGNYKFNSNYSYVIIYYYDGANVYPTVSVSNKVPIIENKNSLSSLYIFSDIEVNDLATFSAGHPQYVSNVYIYAMD